MEEQRTIYERPFILTNDSPENFRKSRATSAKKFSDIRVSSEGRPSHFQKNNQKQNGRIFQKRGKLFASPLLSTKIYNNNMETEGINEDLPKISKKISRSNLTKSNTKSVDDLNENVENEETLGTFRCKLMRRSSSVPESPKDKVAHNFLIKVFIRIKPMDAVSVDDRVLFRENNTSLNLRLSTQKYCFKFENIFDDESGDPSECQKVVYEQTVRGSIESLIGGFNCCLMAYGPTGSGKTYSMIGTAPQPGMIRRFCSDLFASLNSRYTRENFTVQIAYYEIYNERIFDLLSPKDEDQLLLKVRENPQTGPYVDGLTTHNVKSFDEIDILLKRGNARRTKKATLKNDQSSRSHAIFNLKLSWKTVIDDCESFSRSSSVCFVDLAGSEKIAAVVDLRETTTINKSLCFLSKVILQLGNKKQQHVSYRDSILTWLLKDYLGGNAQTHMLVTVRANKDSIEETLNALRFASRAKAVICRVVKEETLHLKGAVNQLGVKRAASIDSLPILSKATTCSAFTQTDVSSDRTHDEGVLTDLKLEDLKKLESHENYNRLLLSAGILTVSSLKLQVGEFYVVLLTSTKTRSLDKSILLLERRKSLTFGSNQFVDVQIENLTPFCCKFSRDGTDNIGLTWLTALCKNREYLSSSTHSADLDPAINGHSLTETCDKTTLKPKDCVRLNGENFVLLWLPQSEDDFVNYYLELESAKFNSIQVESQKSITDLQTKVNSLQEQLEGLENHKIDKDCFECEILNDDVETKFCAGDGPNEFNSSPACSRSASSMGTGSLSFSSDLVDAVNKLKDQYDPVRSVKAASRRFSSLFLPRLVKEANDILASFNKQHFEFSHDRILDENTRQYIQSIRLVNTKLKVYTTLSVETFKFRLESVRCLYEVGDVTGDKVEEKLMSSRDIWRQLYPDDSNLYSLAL